MNDKRKVAFLVKVIRKVYNGLNRPIYTVDMPEKIQEAVFQVELPESSMDDSEKAEVLKEAIEGCFFHPQDHPPSELQHAIDIAYQDEIAKENAEFDKRELMREKEREFVEVSRRIYGKEERLPKKI
tara:strand:- start:60 stop:440 length:381 start_codon:yes stop_codon:yes gene_type:complete